MKVKLCDTNYAILLVFQILVSCCLALFLTTAVLSESIASDGEKIDKHDESEAKVKRGLHELSSHHGHHHHEHIKTITIEKKYPVHYTVEKKVPYDVIKKVEKEVKVRNLREISVWNFDEFKFL